jgi:hypothetical protein
VSRSVLGKGHLHALLAGPGSYRDRQLRCPLAFESVGRRRTDYAGRTCDNPYPARESGESSVLTEPWLVVPVRVIGVHVVTCGSSVWTPLLPLGQAEGWISVRRFEGLLCRESSGVERSPLGRHPHRPQRRTRRLGKDFARRPARPSHVSLLLNLSRTTRLDRTRRSEHGSEELHLRCHVFYNNLRPYRVETVTGLFAGAIDYPVDPSNRGSCQSAVRFPHPQDRRWW